MKASSFFRFGLMVEAALIPLGLGLSYWFFGVLVPFSYSFSVLGFLYLILGFLPMAFFGFFSIHPEFFGMNRFTWLEKIQSKIEEVLGEPLLKLPYWKWILLTFMAGFGEEVLFRGFLQNLIGLFLSSLVFGFFHALTFSYFVLAFGISLYLGWIFNYSGTIIVPVVIHWLYDLLLVVIYRKKLADRVRELETGIEN